CPSFLLSSPYHLDLPSFPTRRSSDLRTRRLLLTAPLLAAFFVGRIVSTSSKTVRSRSNSCWDSNPLVVLLKPVGASSGSGSADVAVDPVVVRQIPNTPREIDVDFNNAVRPRR